MKLLLDELQLKYVVHNEVLLITSPAKAESDEYMTTKVYPVADLVLPIPQMGLSGLGGLGGGMGAGGQGGVGGMMGGGGMGGMGMGGGGGFGGGGMGGMGMGGGGMGGGGMMGGMGGGMGGMMGGMGGGGMFNVPREILPQDKPCLKLFAVQPESVAAQTPAKPEPAPAKVGPIELNRAPATDVRQAWEDFFAQHEPEKDSARLKQMSPEAVQALQARYVKQQQAVLETVQKLKEEVAEAVKHDKTDEATKKHEEIIALIEAALRHDQAQPWMYEILAHEHEGRGPAARGNRSGDHVGRRVRAESCRSDVPWRLPVACRHESPSIANLPTGCRCRTVLAGTPV